MAENAFAGARSFAARTRCVKALTVSKQTAMQGHQPILHLAIHIKEVLELETVVAGHRFAEVGCIEVAEGWARGPVNPVATISNILVATLVAVVVEQVANLRCLRVANQRAFLSLGELSLAPIVDVVVAIAVAREAITQAANTCRAGGNCMGNDAGDPADPAVFGVTGEVHTQDPTLVLVAAIKWLSGRARGFGLGAFGGVLGRGTFAGSFT